MTIRLRTLASGSSGNATFLRFGETGILLDAGIAYARIRNGHLSDKNNTPEVAIAAARDAIGVRKNVRILAAPRHEAGPMLSFTPGKVNAPATQQGILPF